MPIRGKQPISKAVLLIFQPKSFEMPQFILNIQENKQKIFEVVNNIMKSQQFLFLNEKGL